ncbi:MAG TPA: hypothetical protein VGM67_04800 [Gemmatimonadaceae bacterium]
MILACPAAVIAQTADSVATQATRATPATWPTHYWPKLAAGAVTSILAHEAAHVGTSLALGKHPHFGFDEGRPTVYSGISSHLQPRDQFYFSAAGLTMQSLIDEAILDIPHSRGTAFERGVLGGGIGTTVFYLTIGRWGKVSDVDFMARTHVWTKTEVTAIFGTIAASHIYRMSKDKRYANFFVRPAAGAGMDVGMSIGGF